MGRVRAELYITNHKYFEKAAMGYPMAAGDIPGIQLYEEEDEYVILPRGYNPPFLSPTDYMRIEDLRPTWTDVEWPAFEGSLRDNQVQASLALLRSTPGLTDDKLLCLGCGKGKTLLALWYAWQRSKATLVIVDRDFLISQWSDRIVENFRVDRHDIGRIQAGEFVIGDFITIASIDTLKRHEYDETFYDYFGLIIVDEAHMLGAPETQKVLPNFPGERLILTATPERRDGMHPVFLLHAGGMEPCYTDLSRDQSSAWNFINLPDVLNEDDLDGFIQVGKRKQLTRVRHALYRKMPQWPNPRFQRSTYETAAGKCLEFNAQILREIEKACAADRDVLVLGSRTEQLIGLRDSAITLDIDASLVIGEVQGEEREEAFKHRVIFATWQIAGRALDIDRLNTLILLYPTDDEGFLRQAVGRIDRIKEGKKKSIVVVFSHTAHKSLVRKAEQMLEVIGDIDPGAHIITVKRSWLLPRPAKRNTSPGDRKSGTLDSPGPTRKGNSRLRRDVNS